MKRAISMRRRILLLFIFLITFPSLLVYITSRILFISSSERDLKSIYLTNIQGMGTSLDRVFTNALELTIYPLMEPALTRYLTASPDVSAFMQIKQSAAAAIDTIPYGYRTAIHDIGLHTESGDSIVSDRNVNLTESDRAILLSLETAPYWDYSACSSGKDYIYLSRRLRNPNNLSQYIGTVKLAIYSGELRTLMQQSLRDEQTSYYLLTPDNKPVTWVDTGIYTPDQPSPLSYETLLEHIQNKEAGWLWGRHIVSGCLLKNDLILYSITLPEVLAKMNRTWNLSITLLVVIALVGFILLSVYFSRIITSPLEDLGAQMNQLANEDFSTRAEPSGCVETDLLVTHFNDMAQRLEVLYKEVYLGEIRLKESQLQALQSQINPHFLYNTLDTIYWMSKMGNNENVSTMVSSLSSMMRLTLDARENTIPLARECEHLSAYIVIQQMRFQNKIDFLTDIQEGIQNLIVLSFILQPLVENALTHGLANRTHGKVRVRVFTENGQILVYEVSNDGEPLDVEELDELLSGPVTTRRGLALRNIIERLRIKYGPSGALTYFMRENETVFRVVQPVIEAGEEP